MTTLDDTVREGFWLADPRLPVGDSVSGRIGAEDALRLTQYSLDIAANAIFWLMPDASFGYANDAACRLLGYSREELLEMTTSDINPEHPEEVWPARWEDLKEKKSLTFETSLRRKDGWIVPVEITANYVEFGGHAYSHAAAHDITERKRAEQILEREVTRYRALLESTMDGIHTLDGQGNLLECNAAFLRNLGYTREEARHLHVSDWDAQWSKAQLEGVVASLMQTRATFETLHRRKDGSTIQVEITASAAIIDGQKQLYCAARNISERKQAEAALRASQTKYRTLYESSGDAIILSNAEDGFFSGNPAAIRLFGCQDEAEFTCYTPVELSPEYQPDGTLSSVKAQQMNAIAAREGRHYFEWKHRRVDGSEFLATILLTRMELDGKQAFQSTVRDVTEQRRIEARLAQAQKMESIGQLAAGIAHEINTPTQYIGDNAQFLRQSFQELDVLLNECVRLQGSAEDYANTILSADEIRAAIALADVDYLRDEIPKAISHVQEGVQRVAEIVRSMKEFSHPGGDHMQAIDLHKAIESTLTVSRNEWKYVADLTTDFDAELPLVTCLPGEFNQVMLNLIVNAAHAIGEKTNNGAAGKGIITVRTRRNAQWAEIHVEDTGTGISDENRSRIYDPFFTTRPVGQGTGQGLAIAHAIVVEKHHGTIELETQPGEGTTFIVRLPLHDEEEER